MGFIAALVSLLSVLIMKDVILEQLSPLIKESLHGQTINGSEVGPHNVDTHTEEVIASIENNMEIG